MREKAGTLNIFRDHCSVLGLQALIITSSSRAATELDMGLGGCPVMAAVSDNSLPANIIGMRFSSFLGTLILFQLSLSLFETMWIFPLYLPPVNKKLKGYYPIPPNITIFSDKAYPLQLICGLIVPFFCMPGIVRNLAAHSATALAGCGLSGQMASAMDTQIFSVAFVCWWSGITRF